MSSTCIRWLQYCRWMTIATSRFSFPVVRGRGLPATLLPTPVSSVRASLRCPLASGCWPLKQAITQSHHWVAAASHVIVIDFLHPSPTHPILSPSVSKSGDLCGRLRTVLSSPVSSSSKSEVLRKSKLSKALSTVRLRLDERLRWPGSRHWKEEGREEGS